MESTGIPGAIQVTEKVVQLCSGILSKGKEGGQQIIRFTKRGNIPVKGKGSMTTFLLQPLPLGALIPIPPLQPDEVWSF